MSEQDEQRPLTRRERRMRDLEETGAMDLSEIGAGSSDAPSPPVSAARPAAGADIEISPFHPDGTPRSRREMRQLREEALAALGHPVGEVASGAEAPAAGEDDPSAGGAPVAGEVPTAEDAAVAAPVADDALVADDAPVAAEVPVADDAPVVEQAVVVDEAQIVDEAAESDEPAVVASVVQDESVVEPADASGAASESGDPEVVVAEPAAGEPDFDTLMSPPTEPFTVEELREAESAEKIDAEEAATEGQSSDAGAPVVNAAAVAGASDAPVDAPAAEDSADAVPAKSKRRFPWQRSKQASQPAEDPDQRAPEAAEETESDTAASREAEAAADESADEPTSERPEDAPSASASDAEPVVAEIIAEEEPAAEAEPATTVLDAARPTPPAEVPEDLPSASPQTVAFPAQQSDEAPLAGAASASAAATDGSDRSTGANPQERESYSFPDIAPPEEWRSVFDDPSGREFQNESEQNPESGDFDDLISRAVAQEGSTGGTGSSALILPTMPEDTGGLTGPLGATGDLYVTGSLKLPKSLGETGGHSALHDSIEMDPITGDQVPPRDEANEGPAPVSARHAVSARVDSSIPVVAKPTREKSKLPLVLSLTGGGLLVVVVGLGAWGASNGFFG